MLPIALVLGLTTLALPRQDPQMEPAADPSAVLDELAVRTNALEAFRASYELRRSDELEVRFEVCYAAPDRMRLVLEQQGEDGPQQASTWVVGSRLSVRAVGEGDARVVGDLDFAHLPDPAGAVLRALAEGFPSEVTGLGPGPQASLLWGVDPDSDKAEFDLRILYQYEDRTALLGWFDHLRRLEGEWSVGEDVLEWRRLDERIVARLSRVSGFLEHLRLVGADGTTGELELLELDLEPDFESGVFDVPPRGEGAQDLFPDAAQAAFGGIAGLRRMVYRCADSALGTGNREWSPGVRQDWEQVMEALHASTLSRVHATLGEPVQERTLEMAAAVRERIAQRPPGDETVRAELREQVRQWRDGLVRSIDQEQQRYLQAISAAGLREVSSDHLDDLLSLERDLVTTLFIETVREPLLAMFDERLREALGD